MKNKKNTRKEKKKKTLKDHTKFVVELAKQSRPENTDTERKVFKKVSKIIRRILLK